MSQRLSAEEPLSPETWRRLIEAAERPLKVRRAILLLAAHATGGHLKTPHGESCDVCKEPWPCVTVRRAASPALRAFADCDPTQARILVAHLADVEARLAELAVLREFWHTFWEDVGTVECACGLSAYEHEDASRLEVAQDKVATFYERAALHPDPSEGA